jgi:hypothetical protein
MAQARQTLTESGVYLLNTGGQNATAAGLALLLTEDGTQSIVLAVNTAPPGAAVSLTNIPYLTDTLAPIAGGTAITSSRLIYVAAQYAALDLYGTLTATSGSLVVQVSPWNSGGATFSGPVTVTSGGVNITGASVFGDTVAVGNTVDIQAGGLSVVPRVTLNGDPGEATTANSVIKAVTGIANNSATLVGTITVPNSAQAAALRITVLGSLGAGGAIGAYEASASNTYTITVVRTAGVNAVAAISTTANAAAAAVAGAATVTAVVAVGSVAGAVGVENTFPVNITIARSGGSSAAHTCLLAVDVLNAVGSGVTFA